MRVVFFDLETAGIEDKYPIIQFAAIAADVNSPQNLNAPLVSIQEEFEVKFQFDVARADPEALERNSYNAEIWNQLALPRYACVAKIGSFLTRHAKLQKFGNRPPHRPYYVAQLIGHNAAVFDSPRLQSLFKECNKFCPASFLVLDTLQLALWHFFMHPELEQPKNYKLGTLLEYFGIDAAEAHDALYDVRYTIELYSRLVKT